MFTNLGMCVLYKIYSELLIRKLRHVTGFDLISVTYILSAVPASHSAATPRLALVFLWSSYQRSTAPQPQPPAPWLPRLPAEEFWSWRGTRQSSGQPWGPSAPVYFPWSATGL